MDDNKGLKIVLIVLIVLTIIVFAAITYLYVFDDKDNSSKSNYSKKAQEVMKEYNIYNTINDKEYSKTLEAILEEDLYNNAYLNEYYNIDYSSIPDFPNIITNLLNKEYNSNEINYIIKNYSKDLNILLDMEHIDILQFKDITNFDINKLERYLQYQDNNTDYTLEQLVTYVNIGLDLKGYSKYVEYTSEEAKDYSILVNKYHKLPDDYEPDDLVSLSYNSTYKLRKEAAQAFEKLTAAAVLENVYFYPFSPYRSYETQKVLYNRYVARDGTEKADTYSARPGFSEHQLGLAVDVRSSTLTDNLTPEHYEWMLNNSYKYGFIVRYPKGKQYITQFMEEPWHIRYLGVDLATKVHNSGLTYDEYYDLYLETR